MKNGHNASFMSLLVFLSFLVTMEAGSASVPVIPNESIIEGVVLEYTIISSDLIGVEPKQTLYGLTILIESTEQAGSGPDLFSDKKGQKVRFYSKEKLSPDIFNKRMRATVRYAGNEKGGLNWIIKLTIIKERRIK